jgi:hypothetical protein
MFSTYFPTLGIINLTCYHASDTNKRCVRLFNLRVVHELPCGVLSRHHRFFVMHELCRGDLFDLCWGDCSVHLLELRRGLLSRQQRFDCVLFLRRFNLFGSRGDIVHELLGRLLSS